SGKGGTGKTTVATSLALTLENVQFLDCDVEEPDARIFLDPQIAGSEDAGLLMPEIDEAICDWCGICQEICQFNALAVIPPLDDGAGKVLRFDSLCHGCGACSRLCPERAITEVPKKIGTVEWGIRSRDSWVELEFVQGTLDIGQALSPPVIEAVKRHRNPEKMVIVDAPPGTSCPVIAAVDDADYCILVTEPTPFGLHDLTLAIELMEKVGIPSGVIINRSNNRDAEIKELCAEHDIPVLLRIPYRQEIAAAYARGIPLISVCPEFEEKFRAIYETIQQSCREVT
ncbi:MAG TPA: ATP-binding protein, partial [bacterium]|nr:ATP-binding protein [bacterium]